MPVIPGNEPTGPDGPGVIDRRRLLQTASTGALAATIATPAIRTTAQGGTPAPTPAADDALLQVSQALVGGGNLDQAALPALEELVSGAGGLDELMALDPITTESIAAAPADVVTLAGNILQFWYLGHWDGEPIDDLADRYFGLVEWQTVPYATQPTLCKSFGYWATEVSV